MGDILAVLTLRYFCAYSAIACMGMIPGALPQALYFYAFSAC